MQRITTSERKSSTEAAENVGTKSAPFIIEVIKLSPDSANSHVIQAAARVTRCQVQKTSCVNQYQSQSALGLLHFHFENKNAESY